MRFETGQIVWCYHRGRVRTCLQSGECPRFSQVRITGTISGREGMFFVKPDGGGCHAEFIAYETDLGELDDLKQSWGVEPARTDVLSALAAPAPQLSLFG